MKFVLLMSLVVGMRKLVENNSKHAWAVDVIPIRQTPSRTAALARLPSSCCSSLTSSPKILAPALTSSGSRDFRTST